jgi:hypothetical protein
MSMMDAVEAGTMLGERYALGRLLGRGGFGVVHAAHDTVLDVPLAVKILTRCTPAHVVDLKREFRAASALCHPNVVALHELAHDAGQWFLTMELLEGSDLGRWLGGASQSDTRDATDAQRFTSDWAPTIATEEPGTEPTSPGRGRDTIATRDLDSIRHVFAQIAEALAFVHEAGALHCDLKPSNVRITSGDRPVLVDFGLARLLARRTGDAPRFCGTPLYAAPEQLAGLRDSPAVDLFALGTMLFEALSGFVPFVGTMETLVVAKRTRRAVPLAEATPDVPFELAALVDALLDPDPAGRPAARDVARRLRDEPRKTESPDVLRRARRSHDGLHLVGRTGELARVVGALARPGKTVAVVRGPSGIGKTALAEAAANAATAGGALVLRARCFERERGPFEVLDGVGASLAAHLDEGALATDDALTHLLREVAPLVPSIAARVGPAVVLTIAQPEAARDRAADAFARLVGHVAALRPIVVYVDDLQWIDADSAWVLRKLLDEEPDARIALLVTHRPPASGPDQGEGLIDTFGPGRAQLVDLSPLDRDAAAELLRSRFDGDDTLERALGPTLDHAGGSPLLLCELGDLVAEQGLAAGRSLDDVVAARLRRSGSAARDLFELVALARRPVEEGVLLRAAMRGGTHAIDVTRGLLDLVHARLVRAERGPGGGSTRLVVAHAALGEAALAGVSMETTRDHHVAWAEALERAAPDVEAETIARHWIAASDGVRAVRFLRRAADAAAQAFAFSRARELYEVAIRLAPSGAAEADALVIPLGDVLAADGRGAQAARVYARAAAVLGGARALDLERRAAEQLLKSGHIREGTAALDRVIGQVGMRRARSRAGALVDLVRSRLRARRVEWPIDPTAKPVDPAAARRADAAWSLTTGLGFVDPIVAADFSSRHFLEAAHSNDPLRRLRALTGQAVASAGVGEPSRRQVGALLLDASSIADRLSTPRAAAYVLGARAASSALLGSFRASFDAAVRADALFSTEVRDAPWEHVTALHMLMWSALHTGRLGVITERAPPLFAERTARGDRYGATGLGGHYANLAWLVRSPREARGVLDTCASFWRGEAFNLLGYDVELGRVHVCLVEGDAEEAVRRADAAVAALGRAMFLHVAAMRLDATWMRARAVISALAAARGARRVVLRVRVARDIAEVERAPVAAAPVIGALARACLAAALGDHERAHAALGPIAARLEREGLDLLAALARRSAARYRGAPGNDDIAHARILAKLFVPALHA